MWSEGINSYDWHLKVWHNGPIIGIIIELLSMCYLVADNINIIANMTYALYYLGLA